MDTHCGIAGVCVWGEEAAAADGGLPEVAPPTPMSASALPGPMAQRQRGKLQDTASAQGSPSPAAPLQAGRQAGQHGTCGPPSGWGLKAHVVPRQCSPGGCPCPVTCSQMRRLPNTGPIVGFGEGTQRADSKWAGSWASVLSVLQGGYLCAEPWSPRGLWRPYSLLSCGVVVGHEAEAI